MEKIRRKFARFFGRAKDRRGQSTTEYILILLVAVLIAAKFRERFIGANGQGGVMDSILSDVEGKIKDQIGNTGP